MSRTDKTKPWRIRVAEHGGNERNFLYKGQCCHGCGCHLCTAQAERRQDRRRDRHKARRDARAAVKSYLS